MLPDHAVANCSRFVAHGAGGVAIHGAGGVAFFRGVATCSNVWVCPICSPRILHGRRLELEYGLAEVRRRAWGAVLLTATLRHTPGDRLTELLRVLNGAWTRTRSGRAWQAFKRAHGVVGDVVALEPPHGINGWHPHKHAVVILDHVPDADELDRMRAEVSELWRAAVSKLGGWASADWGIDVRGGSAAAHYVTKLDLELTGAESKLGAGVTPFALLAAAGRGDERAAALFREYAAAVAGLQRVRWSRGLKALLGVPEVSDLELAERDEADDGGDSVPCLAFLNGTQWVLAIDRGGFGRLYEVACRGSPSELWRYLAGLGVERTDWNAAREAEAWGEVVT